VLQAVIATSSGKTAAQVFKPVSHLQNGFLSPQVLAKKEEYKKEQVCTVASQGKTDFIKR